MFRPIAVLLLLAPVLAPAQKIAGDWHGLIEVKDDAPLRLAMRIVGSHSLSAALDSIDEGEIVPVDAITVNGSTVRLEIKSIAGSYEGRIAPDGSRIIGSWTQDGGVWPLTWEKGEDPATRTRPLDEGAVMQNGRTCMRWFYEGRLSELWPKLSSVMQQALGGEAGLRDLRERVRNRSGAEIALAGERVKSEGALQVYSRIAKFDQAPSVEVRIVFNPTGAIAGIDIRPVEVQ